MTSRDLNVVTPILLRLNILKSAAERVPSPMEHL